MKGAVRLLCNIQVECSYASRATRIEHTPAVEHVIAKGARRLGCNMALPPIGFELHVLPKIHHKDSLAGFSFALTLYVASRVIISQKGVILYSEPRIF